MNTKLTLTVDESIVADAKEYAKKSGKSISKLFENYIKALTATQKPLEKKRKFSPEMESLIKKTIKLPEDFDYDKALHDARWEKHMKRYEEGIN